MVVVRINLTCFSLRKKNKFEHFNSKRCGNGNNGEDVDLADVELPDEDNARLARGTCLLSKP